MTESRNLDFTERTLSEVRPGDRVWHREKVREVRYVVPGSRIRIWLDFNHRQERSGHEGYIEGPATMAVLVQREAVPE